METKFPLLESITLRTIMLPSMRTVSVISGVAAAALTVIGSLAATPLAHASNFGVELNGTWRAISNGEWARTNEVFMDEPTQISTWTINSSCVSPIECTGTIKSDQGWTASLRLQFGFWTADAVIPHWLPCPDGTFSDINRKLIFWGIDPSRNERNLKITDIMAGRDQNKGPSGGCGINKPIDVEYPLRLERLT
jgi:hypothetical protein